MGQFKNAAEQAVDKLDVVRQAGIVRVRDGNDTWLCRAAAWDAAYSGLETRPPIAGDEGISDAYTALCGAVAAPIASLIGSNRGEYPALIRDAYACGLIQEGDGF